MKAPVKKAKSILAKLVKEQLAGGAPQPVMLWGPPGIGKSDIVKTATKECGIELRDIRLAQLDPVDLRGVPTVENGQTKWAIPSFFPTDPVHYKQNLNCLHIWIPSVETKSVFVLQFLILLIPLALFLQQVV